MARVLEHTRKLIDELLTATKLTRPALRKLLFAMRNQSLKHRSSAQPELVKTIERVLLDNRVSLNTLITLRLPLLDLPEEQKSLIRQGYSASKVLHAFRKGISPNQIPTTPKKFERQNWLDAANVSVEQRTAIQSLERRISNELATKVRFITATSLVIDFQSDEFLVGFLDRLAIEI